MYVRSMYLVADRRRPIYTYIRRACIRTFVLHIPPTWTMDGRTKLGEP